MRTRLAAHPPWKQLVIVTLVLPLVVTAAVMAFAWPSARVAPRDVPVGIVGSTSQSQSLLAGLDAARPGAFDFHLYADAGAAERAVRNRDVDGAFLPAADGVTVLEASAASPALAQVLTTAAGATGMPVAVTDLVPLAPQDPRGSLFAAALLPLTICSILIASAVGVVIRFRPAWRQLLALLNVSLVGAAGVYLIVQVWLGALPHGPVETWLALAAMVFAISSTTAGLVALIGPPGLGLAAISMVFVGNPFSGVTSAPELLPTWAGHQWLPPGAAANLLRSTAYFDGAGAGPHLAVLVAWGVLGTAAIALGHRAPIRFAANARTAAEPSAGARSTTARPGQFVDVATPVAAGPTFIPAAAARPSAGAPN